MKQKAMDMDLQELREMRHDQINEENFSTPNMLKRRAFSYYKPNRDFGDDLEHLHLKKVDNGEFWNNGYR